MEAVAALSLAANVVQFVDFGLDLFSRASAIKRHGASDHHVDLEAITVDLRLVTERLREGIRRHDESTCLAQIDQALDTVAAGCLDLSKEVESTLNDLRITPDKSKWRSFAHALCVTWNAEKIEKLVSRLKTYREQLEFHIIFTLRREVDAAKIARDERFDKLEEDVKSSIDAILSGKALFTNALAEQTATLTKQLEVSDDLADLRHRQTLEAIARGREMNQPQIINVQNPDLEYLASLKEHLRPRAEKMVLDMLYFDDIRQREEDVAEAHKRTFSWVFEAPSREDDGRRDNLQPPASFVQWLRSGKGCFWINGKSASGKSTLMKYINRHNDLELNLKQWGGSHQARKASFYFWNAGSDLQKTHEGLLRSLLYTVLKDQKHLASICFHKHIDEALQRVNVIDEDSKKLKMKKMTPRALSEAFSVLVTKCVADFRLCLLIDGLDEYSGDLPEICELFKRVVDSEMLKIVVTSRPIPVCIEAFSNCPGLILEDLTRSDIHAFVDASLTTHSRMIELRLETPRAAQKLLDDITAKACGVFLWVILVTKSLLSGLSNFDTIDDLSKRLDSYPPELHALYKHMLGNMEPLYRTQASRLLQIAYQRLYLRADRKLTTLQLCLDHDRPSKALATTSNYLGTDEQYKLCREMEGRLRSCCCGLLEVHREWFLPTLEAPLKALVRAFTLNKDELIKSHVQFLHKTVVDFLRDPEIWSFVLSLCEDESFEVNTHLMAASITMMKVMGTREDLTNDCLFYAHRAEVAANKSQTLYLQELNKLHSILPPAPRWWVESPHWSRRKGYYTMANTTIGHVDCFASLAVSKGLVLFFDDILLRDPESIIGSLDKQLILQFVRSFSMEGYSTALFNQQVAIVELLFRSGADPNAKIDDESTIWTTTFAYMHRTMVPGNPAIARRWAQLIDAFAVAGADLNIPLQTGEVCMTPLAILDRKWSGKKSPNPALSALTPSWEVRTTQEIAIRMREAVARQLDEDNPPPLPSFVTRAQLTVMSSIIRDCLIANGAISKVWGEVQGASNSLDPSLLVPEETTPAATLPPCPSSPTSKILTPIISPPIIKVSPDENSADKASGPQAASALNIQPSQNPGNRLIGAHSKARTRPSSALGNRLKLFGQRERNNSPRKSLI